MNNLMFTYNNCQVSFVVRGSMSEYYEVDLIANGITIPIGDMTLTTVPDLNLAIGIVTGYHSGVRRGQSELQQRIKQNIEFLYFEIC